MFGWIHYYRVSCYISCTSRPSDNYCKWLRSFFLINLQMTQFQKLIAGNLKFKQLMHALWGRSKSAWEWHSWIAPSTVITFNKNIVDKWTHINHFNIPVDEKQLCLQILVSKYLFDFHTLGTTQVFRK